MTFASGRGDTIYSMHPLVVRAHCRRPAKALFNVTKTGVTFKARGLTVIPVLDSRGGLEYLDYYVSPARSKFTTNPFIACH
jgi:hypothetical protein